MKTLRFTTTTPYSMLDSSDELRTDIKKITVGEIENIGLTVASGGYIDGDAESIAGFDIPVFLDGNLSQLDRPIEEQEIEMLIEDAVYPIKAILQDYGYKKAYLLQLRD